MKYLNYYKLIIAVLISSLALMATPQTSATDTSAGAFLAGSYYNLLIDDASFIDINSLDVSRIQEFLVSNNSYLKEYTEGGKSAAQIIYDASHGAYPAAVGTSHGVTIDSSTGTINPKIIMIFLQKEQSLISRTTRDDYSLTYAMGYGCPDVCGCACATHPGFSEQVGWGAWQLRYNYEIAKKDLAWWQANYVGNPDTYFYLGQTRTISDYTGSYGVTIQSAGTASTYRYTPHVFDSGYNVWKFWNSWTWPAPPPTGNDVSNFDSKSYGSTISLSGSKANELRAFFNDQLIADIGTTYWAISFEPPIGVVAYYIQYKDSNGGVIDRKPLSIRRHALADINGDSKIDILDLSIFANYWGQNNPAETLANLNPGTDTEVNILDLSIMASRWGG